MVLMVAAEKLHPAAEVGRGNLVAVEDGCAAGVLEVSGDPAAEAEKVSRAG